MKRLPLIIALCAWGLTLSAQSKKALRTFGITYKVETVIEFDADGREKDRYVEEEEYYNADGEWIRKLQYDKDGDLKNEERRTFDKGNIVDYTEIDYNGSKKKDPYFKRRTYTFHKGKITSETDLNREGEVVEKRVYTYNKYGDVIEEIETDENGELKKREVSEYDNRGLKMVETTFDEKGVMEEKKVYRYE